MVSVMLILQSLSSLLLFNIVSLSEGQSLVKRCFVRKLERNCGRGRCISHKYVCDKYGECPVVHPGHNGLCVARCSFDEDCPGIRKCCWNGCGHTCEHPANYHRQLPHDPHPHGHDPHHIDHHDGDHHPVSPVHPDPHPPHPIDHHEVHTKPRHPPSHPVPHPDPHHTVDHHKPDHHVDPHPLPHHPHHEEVGGCPPKPKGEAPCVDGCKLDRECSHGRICCPDYCGHSCKLPVPLKPPPIVHKPPPPHSCPLLAPPDPPPGCGYKSAHGADGCDWYKLVCGTPITNYKHGSCPKHGPGHKPDPHHCVDRCRSDRDCVRDLRCCSNGCALECQAPDYYYDAEHRYPLIIKHAYYHDQKFADKVCYPSPCSSCQKCIPFGRTCHSHTCRATQYRCEDLCGPYDTCKGGRCVPRNPCRGKTDPCYKARCLSYPKAYCKRYSNDCYRYRFVLQGKDVTKYC